MRNNRFGPEFTLRLAVLTAIFAPASVLAGGFSLNEQSASAMGVANAGAAANPENASTVFFNPAGMSQLSGTNISFGVAALDIDAEVKPGTASATSVTGAPVSGNDGGDIAEMAVLPNFFLTQELNDYVDVGFGIHVPYGLAADYEEGFVGRFFADKTELTAVALSPSIAINDGNGFSLGAGINILYAEGRLTKYQDYSALPVPEQTGYADIEGDDIAFTFTFGMLWEVTDRTQLGISGQTGTDLELRGTAEVSNYPRIGAGGLSQVTVTESVMVPLDIPESITFGARHRLTDSVTLLAGATWAKWSRFVALDVVSREPGGPLSSAAGPRLGDESLVSHVSENWKDTWQANVGVIWQATPRWAFKAGYAFDESPVNDNFRTARIPSGDRQWLTLGSRFADPSSGWTVDVAGGVLLFDDEKVNERNYDVNDAPLLEAARYQAAYELDAWGAAVQVSKQF